MLNVVLNIYSGRPNPQWTLTDGQEVLFLAQLKQITRTTLTKPSGVLPRLGYRGFLVSRPPRSPHGPLSLLIQDQIVDFGQTEPNRIADNRELERWLLNTGPQISSGLKSRLTNILAQPAFDSAQFLTASGGGNCPVCQAEDAPAYNPGLWNQPNVQPYNNCYNYANDQMTNTFAQPGQAHNVFPANYDCFEYQQAAAADGLVPCNGFADALAADAGWYVALVMDPRADGDFHWYRQDDNGCWSHKPGDDAATNLDNSGNPITDPAQCDRGDYTDFCTYMITTRNVVIA